MRSEDQARIRRYNICYRSNPSRTPAPLPAPTSDIDRLFADQQYRDYFVSIGGDPDLTPRVISVSTMDGAPSTTAPFFNDYTNVLTVAAPDQVTLARILRGPIERIEASIRYAPPARYGDQESECSRDLGGREHVPSGVCKIEAPEVWKSGITGKSVTIAIVDTGLEEEHPDLPRPIDGLSFVPGDTSIVDKDGHGTYVTGIALARENRKQIVGVAHGANLIVARAGNDKGESDDSWIAAAITWSAIRGANVINVSLVGRKPTEVMRRAVLCAIQRKSVICAAAGNGGIRRLDYPAAYPETISVGATQIEDVRCDVSNWTDEMTTWAPGCPILSTSLKGGTKCERGTSAATPHVSGVVALMLQKDSGLTLDEIRERIQATGAEVMGGAPVRRIDAVGCVTHQLTTDSNDAPATKPDQAR